MDTNQRHRTPQGRTTADVEADVVIVGAGPVGLGLALELTTRGVSVAVVEMSPRISPQPRAKLVNVRSMTLLRRWGIAEDVRRAAPLGSGWSGDIAFVTSLTGHEITRFPDALMTQSVPDGAAPETALTIPQYALEKVLRTVLDAAPDAALLDRRKVIAAVSGRDHVLVTAVDADGRETLVRGRYLVGCDGARSTVRRLLDVPMTGTPVIARNLGVVFRCTELKQELQHERAVQYWILSADAPGITGRLDADDLWWAQLTGLGDQASAEAVDVHKHLAGMIGRDLPIEVTGTDPWAARSLLATTYRVGRAFLAGDAAHLHPPMGGYGMNMGIGDAVDLGWKLAAVVRGEADEQLLDTYTDERRLVHKRVLQESTRNYRTLSHDLVTSDLDAEGATGDLARATLAEEIAATKAREFRSLGIQLGVAYVPTSNDSTGADEGDASVTKYRPIAAPGHLAPHATLPDGTSLYDRLGPGLTLLVHPEAVDRFSTELCPVVSLDGSAVELYQAPVTLVRPDQYVAYAGDPAPDDLPDIVRQVLAAGIIHATPQEAETV